MEEFVPRGRATIALKLLDPQVSDSILDIGCNQGYFERYYLIGKAEKVRAIDIDPQAIEYAQMKDGEEYYVCCNSASLPFLDREFDKVLCLDTLEHVDDEKKTISEIKRVLKPNGLLVLSTPNDFLNFMDLSNIRVNFPKVREIYRRLRRKSQSDVSKFQFHRHYSVKQLRQMLIGFNIEKIHRSSLLLWFVVLLLRSLSSERCRFYTRKVTGYIEDLDYCLNYRFGFSLIIAAHKDKAKR
ncbi:MAG TPA: class I SAM-dependent methyltransferase [Candidatus Scalindua sp.]|nr:class I SAM-dependent methyltransferase [Candidatus Scalindua sp.]